MSNTLYNYADINEYDNSKAILLLLIAPEHYSAAVIDNHQLIIWADHQPIDELLNSEESSTITGTGYAQVIAGVQTTKFTLWPKLYPVAELAPDVARLLDISSEDKVITGTFDTDNEVVFTVNQQQAALLGKYSAERRIVFAAGPWAEAIKKSGVIDEPALYLNVKDRQLDILCLSGDKVKFYNHFIFHNSDEMVYYTLLAAQQLGLDLTLTQVKISGDVQPADHCISRLAEFFKVAAVNDLKLLDLPEEIQPHQILALSALSLCAS